MNDNVKELLKKVSKELITIEGVEEVDFKLQSKSNQFTLLSSIKNVGDQRNNDYGLTAVYDKDNDTFSVLFEGEN